jgi:hypothetical protein
MSFSLSLTILEVDSVKWFINLKQKKGHLVKDALMLVSMTH